MPTPKLLHQVRDRLRVKHYTIRSVYVDWIKRLILFHGKRHPRGMGVAEVEAFLTHLAVVGKVAASTQNPAKVPQRLPVVLNVSEVQAVLGHLKGSHRLLAKLRYGAGLRVLEAVRRRVENVEFAPHEIMGRGA